MYSVNTGRKIIALKPLSDPDKIAVVNDKNEITVYSLRQQKLSDAVLLPENEKSSHYGVRLFSVRRYRISRL